MDWLGCLFNADSCLSFGFKWRLILVLALGAACALGAWSLGQQLDQNWGTDYMAFLLGFVGALIGLAIGIWLVKPTTE